MSYKGTISLVAWKHPFILWTKILWVMAFHSLDTVRIFWPKLIRFTQNIFPGNTMVLDQTEYYHVYVKMNDFIRINKYVVPTYEYSQYSSYSHKFPCIPMNFQNFLTKFTEFTILFGSQWAGLWEANSHARFHLCNSTRQVWLLSFSFFCATGLNKLWNKLLCW